MNTRKWNASLGFAIFISVLSLPAQAQREHDGLSDRVTVLEGLVASLQAQVAELRAALDKEAAARQAADQTLQNNLTTEATARAGTDTELLHQIMFFAREERLRKEKD